MIRDVYVSFRHRGASISISLTAPEREALTRHAFGSSTTVSDLVRGWLRTAAGDDSFPEAARRAGVPVSGWYRLVILHALGESELGEQLARVR